MAVNATPGTHTASLTTEGSDVLNKSGGPTSLTFSALYQGAIAKYSATTKVWTVTATDDALGQPLGAARVGSDGYLGTPGKGGTQLSPSVVLPYGLAIGKGLCNVPVGLRAQVIADSASNGTDQSYTFRIFCPLTDPEVLDVLPVFTNPSARSGVGGDIDSPNPITIAAAVELSDGTVQDFTFNGGNHTVTIPGHGCVLVTPDSPINIGAQVSNTGKRGETYSGFWLRTYISVAAARTDTCGITNGSPNVTDVSILSTDAGRLVTGTGIPSNTYIANVVAGTSFQLSSDPYSYTAVNATATNASASLGVKSIMPLAIGALANGDNLTAANGADLTLPGSGTVSGGAGSSNYGPAVILGKAKARKPIVALVSDSILDGYSESFQSTYWGPVARACATLGIPFVKVAKGGETASSWAGAKTRRYRAPFLEGCTHAIVELGTNDGALQNSITALQTRLTQIGQFLASMGIAPYVVTVPPRTTSTDNFATTTNQTPLTTANPTYVALFNNWLRGLPSPYVGIYDMANDVMSSTDSGLWVVNGTANYGTPDGVHPSSAFMLGTISTNLQTLISTFTV